MRISVKKRTNEFSSLSIAFLMLLVMAGFYAYLVQSTPMFWIGIGAVVVSILGFSYSIIREQLLIEIDSRGIYDRGLGVGKIRWKDVEDIYLQTTDQSQYLCFSLKNPEVYLRRLRGHRRNTALYHRQLGLNRFNVDIGHVDIDPIDLKRLVDLRVEQHSMRR